jgi:hypothetical protein
MGAPVTAHRAGVPLSTPDKSSRSDYANRLRLNVRKGRDSGELVDRLLVFALIELRSCERFDLLARNCRGRDVALSRFSIHLGSSELGHYHVFLRLAIWLFAPTRSKRVRLSVPARFWRRFSWESLFPDLSQFDAQRKRRRPTEKVFKVQIGPVFARSSMAASTRSRRRPAKSLCRIRSSQART